MDLTLSEEMLFALLRASLHAQPVDESFFTSATDDDWNNCFHLAVTHGVAALAWDGVMLLPVGLYPPLELKMKWGMRVKKQEKKYVGFCKIIHELTCLYEKHGICTVLLKGVGLSSLYPVPSHREGGDIDIFTISNDKSRMNDVEANDLADRLMMEWGHDVDLSYAVKHSIFTFNGIPVENHKKFVNVWQIPLAKKVDSLLLEYLQPQKICLTEDEYMAYVPSVCFNSVFIPFHAAQHYGSGLAIHHLCDWAMLIKRYGIQLPIELKDKCFIGTIAAFTHLCNTYLGTDVGVEGGERLASDLMKSMLRSGAVMQNTCKYPVFNLIDKFRGLYRLSLMKQRVFGGSVWIIFKNVLMRILWKRIDVRVKNRRRN